MRNALLVDELGAVGTLLRHVLEGTGYAVAYAPDGAAALEALRASHGPLVTLFNMSTHSGGLQLLRAALVDPAVGRHAFVLVTAYPEGISPQWQVLLAELATPVVAKPFALATLLAAIATAAARLHETSGCDGEPLVP